MQDTSHLHVEFFVMTVEDPVATAKEGIPKFKDEEHVRIKFAGDKHQELVAPANDKTFDPETRVSCTYKEMFPRHYAAFLENRQQIDGTPIEELPGITGAKVAEFKAQRVFTVEALAGLDGTPLQRLGMGGREWKDRAANWLSKAKEGAVEARLTARNAALEAQIAELREMIAGGASAVPKADDEPKIEVVQEGRFAGHTASDLRRFIETTSGTKVKGNPKLATLKTMAEELAVAADA